MWRMDQSYHLCFWGCRLWCAFGDQQDMHEHQVCHRRSSYRYIYRYI
jgi:hypothetical protein